MSALPSNSTEVLDLTQSRPENLGAAKLEVIRQFLHDDLFLFALVIFNYTDLQPALHGEMARLIQRWGTPGHERILFQVPRGCFKTSLVTIANSLWQLTREPSKPIGVFGAKDELVKEMGASIKDVVLGSDWYRALFPHMLPPDPMPRTWTWRDDKFNLPGRIVGERHASWTGMGITTGSTGGHWPKIILDDLIGREAAKSEAMMHDAYDFADKLPYLMRPVQKAPVIGACTTWTYNDVYTHMIRKHKFKVYKRAAIEDGKSIFPERLSLDELHQMQEVDEFGFSAQMLLNPRPGKSQALPTDALRYGRVETNGENRSFVIRDGDWDPSIMEAHLSEEAPKRVPLELLAKSILWDPAPPTPDPRATNSRHGILVVGRDGWGRRFILDCLASRDEPLEVIYAIFKLAAKWGVTKVGVEEVSFTRVYSKWFYRESTLKGLLLQVVALKPKGKEKNDRILELSPMARSGFLYLNSDTTRPFYQEWIEHPYGDTQDLLDAGAYMDQIVLRPAAPEEWAMQRRQALPDDGGRDVVTGY